MCRHKTQWQRDFKIRWPSVHGQHPPPPLAVRSFTVASTPAYPPPCAFKVFSLQELAGDILTIMRLRLKRFLNFLETSPRASRGLLASLDADTCQWVRSARDAEAATRGAGQGGVQSEKEAGEPLRSTHGVLLCLARALPRESRHKVGRRC